MYTDYFLDRLIDILQKKNALVVYISDHGESLGEDGLWLHANDHHTLKNPAALIWMSDKYVANYPEKREALILNKDKRWRTDYVFHTILSGANIPSTSIQNDLNVFAVP